MIGTHGRAPKSALRRLADLNGSDVAELDYVIRRLARAVSRRWAVLIDRLRGDCRKSRPQGDCDRRHLFPALQGEVASADLPHAGSTRCQKVVCAMVPVLGVPPLIASAETDAANAV
jgi:hypothetical protein